MDRKSPFPGMDPFIEARGLWGDFHGDLMNSIKRFLNAQLPRRYVARAGERSYIDAIDPADVLRKRRTIIPDVSIQERPNQSAVQLAQSAVEELGDESVVMYGTQFEEIHESYLDIRDLETDNRLVTSIEILSPTNKRPSSKGWEEYESKRSLFFSGMANLIEIDLLRGGERHVMKTPWPDSPYYLMVMRNHRAPACRVWPAYSTRPLRPIPVPLLPFDPDLTLALQPMIDDAFVRSRYEVDVRYNEQIELTLSEEERALASRTT